MALCDPAVNFDVHYELDFNCLMDDCEECEGAGGMWVDMSDILPGMKRMWSPCGACQGRGTVPVKEVECPAQI